MRLRDLSYRGLAVLTGIIVFLPEIIKVIILIPLVLMKPDGVNLDGKIKLGVFEITANDWGTYILFGALSLLVSILFVLIFASILSVLFNKTRLGNIWIARASEEQLRMKKTFD